MPVNLVPPDPRFSAGTLKLNRTNWPVNSVPPGPCSYRKTLASHSKNCRFMWYPLGPFFLGLILKSQRNQCPANLVLPLPRIYRRTLKSQRNNCPANLVPARPFALWGNTLHSEIPGGGGSITGSISDPPALDIPPPPANFRQNFLPEIPAQVCCPKFWLGILPAAAR